MFVFLSLNAQRFVKHICIISIAFISFAASYCLRLPTSNSSGYMIHATGYNGQLCNWKFDNNPNRINILMVFKVLKSDTVGWVPHYCNFYTPDNPGVKWWRSGPFCRIYAKSGSSVKNCKPGDKRTDLCENVIQESVMWPPIIKSDFAKYSAVMSFDFIDCVANVSNVVPDIVVVKSDTTTHNNTSFKHRINTTDKTQMTRTTTLTTGTSALSAGQTAPPPSVFVWVSVVLAVLLMMALTAIVYLLIKIRKIDGSSHTKDKSPTKPQDKEIVVNELYHSNNPTFETETAYNALYNP